MSNKKYKITLELICEAEDGPWLSNKWFERDLMQEIGCCIEFYELESIKIEEANSDVTGKQS